MYKVRQLDKNLFRFSKLKTSDSSLATIRGKRMKANLIYLSNTQKKNPLNFVQFWIFANFTWSTLCSHVSYTKEGKITITSAITNVHFYLFYISFLRAESQKMERHIIHLERNNFLCCTKSFWSELINAMWDHYWVSVLFRVTLHSFKCNWWPG